MAPRPGEALNQYDASISSAIVVDPSGGNVTLARITRGLWVGVSGDVSVTFVGDAAPVIMPAVAAGMWHPMQLQSINQTGTTATGIRVGF